MSDNPVLFAIALTSGLLAGVLAAVVVLDNVAGIWREWRYRRAVQRRLRGLR